MEGMKISATIIMCVLVLAGCRTRPSWTETTIAEGQYEVSLPALVSEFGRTNNPTITVYGCGRMQIDALSSDNASRGDIWIDWLSNQISGQFVTTNGLNGVGFRLGFNGTNIVLDVDVYDGRGPSYTITIDKDGKPKLEVKKRSK